MGERPHKKFKSKGILALQKSVKGLKKNDTVSPKMNVFSRSSSNVGGPARGKSGKSQAIFGGINKLISMVSARDTPKSVGIKSPKRSRIPSRMSIGVPTPIPRVSSIAPSMKEIMMTMPSEESPT